MKVLKPFTCKVTRRRYEAGQDYDGDRGAELAAKGFVEEKEKAEQGHTPKADKSKPKKHKKDQ